MIWVFITPDLQERMLFIPRDLLMKSADMDVTFQMTEAVSPVQMIGFNGDKRVLGLAVHTIELRE